MADGKLKLIGSGRYQAADNIPSEPQSAQGWGFSFGRWMIQITKQSEHPAGRDRRSCRMRCRTFFGHQLGLARRKRIAHALPVAVDEDQRLVLFASNHRRAR